MKIKQTIDTRTQQQWDAYIYDLKKAVVFMNDLERIRKVILKWKINRALLALKVGMPKTTFSYIIEGKPHYKISPAQLKKLKMVISRMSDDFKTIR
jgi:hypothetical protein